MSSTAEFLMASHNHEGGVVGKRSGSSLRVIRVRGKTIAKPVGCVAAALTSTPQEPHPC